MGKIKPFDEHNAIKEVAFVIELTDPVGNKTIEKLLNMHSNNIEDFNKKLPSVEKLYHIHISSKDEFARKFVNGLMFSEFQNDGTAKWSLSIKDNQLIVKCGKYTRWVDVWGTAKDFILFILNQLGKLEEIKWEAAGLEYVDEFEVIGEENDWVNQLFSESNDYLPKNIYNLNHQLWHCNQGWFSNIDDISQNLNNVDVSKLQKADSGNIVIKIRTAHITRFHKKNTQFVDTQLIEKYMNENHGSNKAIFKNLLTPVMCERIKLK